MQGLIKKKNKEHKDAETQTFETIYRKNVLYVQCIVHTYVLALFLRAYIRFARRGLQISGYVAGIETFRRNQTSAVTAIRSSLGPLVYTPVTPIITLMFMERADGGLRRGDGNKERKRIR